MLKELKELQSLDDLNVKSSLQVQQSTELKELQSLDDLSVKSSFQVQQGPIN